MHKWKLALGICYFESSHFEVRFEFSIFKHFNFQIGFEFCNVNNLSELILVLNAWFFMIIQRRFHFVILRLASWLVTFSLLEHFYSWHILCTLYITISFWILRLYSNSATLKTFINRIASYRMSFNANIGMFDFITIFTFVTLGLLFWIFMLGSNLVTKEVFHKEELTLKI